MLHLWFFFLLVIMKELGLNKNTASISKTYTQVNKYNSWVSSHHATFLKNEFTLESTVLTHICKLQFFQGLNLFWVARNNQPVIDAINRVKVRRKAFSITIMTSLLSSTQIFHTINKVKTKQKTKQKKR